MTEEPRFRKLTQGRARIWLLAFLTVSASYLYAFPQPNIFYAGVVLLHALAGVIATLFLLLLLPRWMRSRNLATRLGWILLTIGRKVRSTCIHHLRRSASLARLALIVP